MDGNSPWLLLSKAFDTIYYHIHIFVLRKYALDKLIIRGLEN